MLRKAFHSLRSFDWHLIINILLLMFFGLAALYSLQLNVSKPDFTLFQRQAVFFAVGLLLFFIFSRINFHFWADYYKVILLISALLLLGVLVAGVKLGGTTGWFSLAGLNFQPVELAKLALVIFLSRYFSQHIKEASLRHVIISGAVTGILIFLVILQPDFGSAMILLISFLAFVMFLPFKRKFFVGLLLVLILLVIVSWFFVLQGYQQERILTFINPQRDPLDAGYNVTQSIIAVGSGRYLGRGLALGSQSQLNFLPTQETDFIFAVIAEELGLVGAGILLLLFLSLFWHLFKMIKTTTDGFGAFLILGIFTFLLIQLFINIGMNLGVAPVAGLPLPLVSYGGSSLITTLMALGIVHNIYLKNREKDYG